MLYLDTRESKKLVRSIITAVEGSCPKPPIKWEGHLPWSVGRCIVRTLPYGDYFIGGVNPLLIERKEVKDLISTYIKKKATGTGGYMSRLRWQLEGCASQAPGRAALLVEGTLEEEPMSGFTIANGFLRQVKFQSIQRLLLDLQQEGYMVIRTATTSETVATIAALHRSLYKKGS